VGSLFTEIDHSKPPWQDRVRGKQSPILAPVPKEYIHPELSFSETDTKSVLDAPAEFLLPLELSITAPKAEDIVSAISKGEHTAVQVLKAFTHRAAIAHRLLHCCLEFLYPAARAKAERPDKYFARTGKTVRPLYGLPALDESLSGVRPQNASWVL